MLSYSPITVIVFLQLGYWYLRFHLFAFLMCHFFQWWALTIVGVGHLAIKAVMAFAHIDYTIRLNCLNLALFSADLAWGTTFRAALKPIEKTNAIGYR